MTTIELNQIITTGEKYATYCTVGSEDASDGWSESGEWRDSIKAVIDRLAKEHGWTVTCDYDSISTYLDCDLYDADLETVDSFQVRLSNHKQRYSGPLWSFQPDDTAKMIQMGMDEIAARMANPEI